MTNLPATPPCYRHPNRPGSIKCQRCGRPICPECMREAPVGFQCVECVSQGQRSTRQGQAAFGGSRSDNPALTSIVLIGLNVAVWVAIMATGQGESRLVQLLSLQPDGGCLPGDGFFYPGEGSAACSAVGGTFLPGVVDGAYWQLITSAFSHVALWHIAGNMLSLWFLGPRIEQVMGRTRFLVIYFVSALAGSAVVYWLADPIGYTLGASGAIFGLLGALGVLIVKTKGDLQQLAMLLVINVIITFAVPNVSWQGHLGGLLGGAVVTAALVYTPRSPRRSAVQGLLIGSFVALLLMAILVRSALLAA